MSSLSCPSTKNPKMDPPPSSSSSSSMCRRNYAAFLSFRGIDTRPTFISHLYEALRQKGVYTFKDSEELELGDRRSELFDAVEGSRIAIITFSENYARSKWCLDELQKIMERKEQGKLTVIPIFYHVSPGEVRLHEKDDSEKGCYQIAMEEMEAKYGKDSEMVKRWKKALWQGGDLIGISVGQRQDESDVIREVVEKVLKQLNRVHLEVAKYPVGIERHLEAIRPSLQIDPHDDGVYMVGLHGQGGAGKTTLSKAICNDIADRFDSWCFLPNVRETTSRVVNGLAHLQQTLLRKLLRDENLKLTSVDEGKQLIKERLRNKRVHVILDDVDELNQLDALAGNLNWFGKGSRIIITTRDKHVLPEDRVKHVHLVELLHREEAENLFRLHAFGEKPGEVSINGALVDSFLKYAGKLPLALVVLGASLFGRSTIEWEDKLKELAMSSDKTINSVLKISLDGLEDSHKEMFLDIACFFKGWEVDRVEKILDSCDFAKSLGISILVERCLVTIVSGKIQIHDLLEAMGRNLVRDEYIKSNRILSRIWLYEDFLDILSKDRERKNAVKGIVLNFSDEEAAPVKADAFMGFTNLRILIVRNVAGPKKRLQLPRELRWLEWQSCSAHTIEFDPYSELVGLDLHYSETRQIKGRMGFKKILSDYFGRKGTGFKELKYVNLSWCHSIQKLPDFSESLKLEDLNLSYCSRLTTLDEAIGSLENLVHMDLRCCGKLVKAPCSLRSKRLRTLHIGSCQKLYKLPAIKEELTFLENLDLSFTGVKELPDSFGNLVALKDLFLSSCTELTTIPSSIYKLRGLKKLCIKKCGKLSGFPRRPAGAASNVLGFPNLVSLDISYCELKDLEFLNDLTCFDTLMWMDFSGNEFDHVPACISKFKNLKKLQLSDCGRLVELSELPNVSTLIAARCRRLKTFPSLHMFICQTPSWFRVDLSNCLGIDSGYIDRSLPLEKVRGFVGGAHVLISGEEFPHWVNFRTEEWYLRHLVSLPCNISVDDLLGLALFVSFERDTPPLYVRFKGFLRAQLNVRVGDIDISANLEHGGDGGHTLFVYLPCQLLSEAYHYLNTRLNWHNLTLEISRIESAEHVYRPKRCGMRLLCKREQDDHRIQVRKYEDNESHDSSVHLP